MSSGTNISFAFKGQILHQIVLNLAKDKVLGLNIIFSLLLWNSKDICIQALSFLNTSKQGSLQNWEYHCRNYYSAFKTAHSSYQFAVIYSFVLFNLKDTTTEKNNWADIDICTPDFCLYRHGLIQLNISELKLNLTILQ